MQSKVEQKRVKDANRAVEHRKKEELKADQIVHNAEVRSPFLFDLCSSVMLDLVQG